MVNDPTDIIGKFDRAERVASVLARATALSEELRTTIKELEVVLRREDDELEFTKEPGKGE